MDQEKETKRQAERCRALAQRIVRELTPAGVQVLGGSGSLEKALENELEFLQQLGTAGLDDLCPKVPAFLPRWEVSPDANYAAAYQARRAAVGQKGYGMFARHHVFTIEDGRLVPVRYPDPQRLSCLLYTSPSPRD